MARIVRASANSRPRLTRCEFYPVGSVGERQALLQTLADKYQLANADCTSLMEADQSNLLLVEAPEVDATELKAAVRWRIKDLIDFHIDDAVIDVFDIEGQRERGRAKMMYVVVARISAVKEHIDLLEHSHINLNAIDIAELAQRNVAALLPEDETGIALLRFSRHDGLLTISRQGNLFLARALDFGVDQLTAELAPAGIPAEDGPDLVLPSDDDDLPPRLRRLFDNIVLEVQRSLDYYESHFGLPPVGGVVIAPMEQAVPGLLGYLSANLGLPVRQLDLNTVLESETVLGDETQARCFSAIGAALRVEEKVL